MFYWIFGLLLLWVAFVRWSRWAGGWQVSTKLIVKKYILARTNGVSEEAAFVDILTTRYALNPLYFRKVWVQSALMVFVSSRGIDFPKTWPRLAQRMRTDAEKNPNSYPDEFGSLTQLHTFEMSARNLLTPHDYSLRSLVRLCLYIERHKELDLSRGDTMRKLDRFLATLSGVGDFL